MVAPAASPHDVVPSPGALRAVALSAARAVAPALAAAFRAGPTRGAPASAETKSNHHDLVTVHDRRTEERIVAALTAAVPGSRVLGEELGRHGGGADAEGAPPLEWIVDPIDGTSNFAHGFAMFSVSIAAAVHGEVVAGVVLDPVNGLAFSADEAGAYLGDAPLAEVGRPAPAGGERALNVVTSYPAGEALDAEGEGALRRFGRLVATYATVRRTVSGALELCHVAAGWADAALLVDTKPWDVAAGQLILRRAGGAYLTPAGPGAAGLTPDSPRAHEAAFALALAPHRAAPTAEAVLGELLAVRADGRA
ncbi:inositol monophosphatase family protein [Micrococcus sp. NPDC078436]|uniref:inositol monophosphatase family protein n=1 Tax=unclassified Micrococcus TaxID=2620948 RepID=UPI0029B3329C|nr:inositol monophosphatase family protein [Micrococcus sp. M4NT]MDX2341190.1 inositol monophosphatase [Micrococcus sp. M4NT]